MKRIFLLSFLVFLAQCTSTGNSRQVAATSSFLDASGYSYVPGDTSCDGYPNLKVKTLAGTCLGMVFSQDIAKNKNAKFVMPRVILSLPLSENDKRNSYPGDFFLTDMGGWATNKGVLYWLRYNPASRDYDIQALKTKLNLPHALAIDKNGYIYLGENQKITRFKFNGLKITNEEVVIDDLAANKGDMHPLTQIAFNPANGDMFINSGAPTDHCSSVKGRSCAEEHTQDAGASILRVPGKFLAQPLKAPIRVREVAAQGLRNSMAMVVTPSGSHLIQGENSRDFPELEEPYEEMNLLPLGDDSRGYHFGWPYCYNINALSPEWLFPENAKSPIRSEHGVAPFSCATDTATYQRPLSLIPPHAAPLHTDYYKAEMLKKLIGGYLLMSWHGYRQTGQRLVAYPVNAQGIPVTSAMSTKSVDKNAFYFNVNQTSGCAKRSMFNPRDGIDKGQHAPYVEVISGWNDIKGVRPKGAPVGFTVAHDGSIWIVEDKNKTIVRLSQSSTPAADEKCNSAPGLEMDPNIQLLAWRNAIKTDANSEQLYVYLKDRLYPSKADATLSTEKGYCVGCHSNFRNTELSGKEDRFTFMDFLVRSQWVNPTKPNESPIVQAIQQNGGVYPPMPPSGSPPLKGSAQGEQIINTMVKWIGGLPQDIESRYTKVIMKANLRVRDKAGGTVCGQFMKDDIAYIDPRKATKIESGGYTWSKVYMVPNHTRLFFEACPYPEDGVFYTAY